MLKRLATLALLVAPMVPTEPEHSKIAARHEIKSVTSEGCDWDVTIRIPLCDDVTTPGVHTVVIEWEHMDESGQGYIQVWSQVGDDWLQIDSYGLGMACQTSTITSFYVLQIPQGKTHTIHIELWAGGGQGPQKVAGDAVTFH